MYFIFGASRILIDINTNKVHKGKSIPMTVGIPRTLEAVERKYIEPPPPTLLDAPAGTYI